jgi:TetR/AcrR family transcriptional repressor of nem operon
MAGVKQFNQDDLLDQAMEAFWRNGYQGTSIHDLVEATGVNRGSLYATFGDKCGLFLAVLDHYGKRIGRPMMEALSHPNPRQAIQGMFELIIGRIRDPQYPRGCLFTNTSLECPSAGDAIGRSVAEILGQQEAAIYQVLRRAQIEGELDPHEDAQALARFFLGVAQGLNVVNKASPDPSILDDIMAVAMRVWDEGAKAITLSEHRSCEGQSPQRRPAKVSASAPSKPRAKSDS